MGGLDGIREGNRGLRAVSGWQDLLRAAVRSTAGGRAALAVLRAAVLLGGAVLPRGVRCRGEVAGVACLAGLAAGRQAAELGGGRREGLGRLRIGDGRPVLAYPLLARTVFAYAVFSWSVYPVLAYAVIAWQ
jgi:hypothetical protein